MERIMAKYVLCPRCELNYMLDGEEYCDICKAELKKGPGLLFAIDEEESETLELCPRCQSNPLKPGEEICEKCRNKYDVEKDVADTEDENSWKEYMDEEEEEEEESEEMLSLSKLV